MNESFSPMKTKRLDEKSSLQNLNGRLEMYVSRVREMEEAKCLAERELEAVRQRANGEMETLRNRYCQEIEQLQRDVQYEFDFRNRLQVLEQDQYNQITTLSKEVEGLRESKERADELEQELKTLRMTCAKAVESCETTKTELNVLKKSSAQLERKNRELQQTLNLNQVELDELRSFKNAYTTSSEEALANLRRSLTQQHNKELEKVKKECEEKIQRSEHDVRQMLQKKYEEVEAENERLVAELEVGQTEFNKINAKYEETLKTQHLLTHRVSEIEKEYRDLHVAKLDERKRYEDALNQSREAKLAKDKEFDELMDIKIALDSEISTYRSILDQEETRVGYSSAVKRKSDHDAAPSSKKRRTELGTPRLKIIDVNTEREFVVIENMFPETLNLKDYVLHSQQTGGAVKFSAKDELQSKEQLTIVSGRTRGEAIKEFPNSKIKTTRKCMWEKYDIATLSGPDGTIVDKFSTNENIIPATSDEINHGEDLTSPEENGCILM